MQGKTLAEHIAWIREISGKEASRALSYKLDNNPVAAYAAITALWPKQFDNLGAGAESTTYNIERMYEFVWRKAQQSGNVDAFVQQFGNNIPYNSQADNWTNIIS